MTQTLTARDDRLNQAAEAIDMIQSCLAAKIAKDSAKLRSLSATMRTYGDKLKRLMETETAYDQQTFIQLAEERLSMMRLERAKKAKARRMKREEHERARALFLADLAGLTAH